MNSSAVLAQIIGAIFLVGGLQALFHWKSMSDAIEKAVQEYALMWIIGLISLTLGSTIVALQNLWVSDWRIVVTIIGWAGILKGALIMLFPDLAKSMYHACSTRTILMSSGIVATVVGVFLLYMGLHR
jgi:uncharacterized protein YjeT (DUF2065 family)